MADLMRISEAYFKNLLHDTEPGAAIAGLAGEESLRALALADIGAIFQKAIAVFPDARVPVEREAAEKALEAFDDKQTISVVHSRVGRDKRRRQ